MCNGALSCLCPSRRVLVLHQSLHKIFQRSKPRLCISPQTLGCVLQQNTGVVRVVVLFMHRISALCQIEMGAKICWALPEFWGQSWMSASAGEKLWPKFANDHSPEQAANPIHWAKIGGALKFANRVAFVC